MTRRRLYIQKYPAEPSYDLWLEVEKIYQEVPVINLCFNDKEQGQKRILVTLTQSAAIRMVNGLNELIEKCSKPLEDYVSEEDFEQ